MNNLETSRILLRHFLSSDFDCLKLMLMDSEVMSFTGFKKVQSEESSKELLEKWIKDDFIWAAINKENNNLVGWFMLKKTISKECPEIGFMLDKSCWNQGFATEVGMTLITFAKKELGAKKVIARVDVKNLASIKVLEKIGMCISYNILSKDNIVYYEVDCIN